MSNERIDEFLSWRGRLDGPEGVPGQGLDDKEATWERLMARAPRRRRWFWGYRIAAACLLLALIPAARFFHEKPMRVVEVRPAVVKRVMRRVDDPVTASRNPTAVRRVVADHREREKRVTEAVKVAEVAEPSVAVVLSPDSLGTSVVAKPLKKKELKVVNINEVSGSTAPSPAVTATGRNVDFSIEPGQLKVKLSSSN